MPAPTVSPISSPILIAVDTPYALQLSASPAATSWAATDLPTGLTIDSAGRISGTPTVTDWFEASITASNDDGTSAAVTVGFLVLAGTIGTTTTAGARKIDWELSTGKLKTPGSPAWQPAGEPPVNGESLPVATWKIGDVFDLSIGLMQSGVLIQPAGVTGFSVAVRLSEDADPVELQGAELGMEGLGSLTRFVVDVALDAAALASAVDEGELEDGRNTYVDGLLELSLHTASVVLTSLSAPIRLMRELRA